MNDPQLKKDNRDQNLVELIREKLAAKESLLDLEYESIGDEGLIFLTRVGDLSHVNALNLSWNEITSAGLECRLDRLMSETILRQNYPCLRPGSTMVV